MLKKYELLEALGRGRVVTTISELAKKMGTGKSKISMWLHELEDEGRIFLDTTGRKTTILVYDVAVAVAVVEAVARMILPIRN